MKTMKKDKGDLGRPTSVRKVTHNEYKVAAVGHGSFDHSELFSAVSKVFELYRYDTFVKYFKTLTTSKIGRMLASIRRIGLLKDSDDPDKASMA